MEVRVEKASRRFARDVYSLSSQNDAGADQIISQLAQGFVNGARPVALFRSQISELDKVCDHRIGCGRALRTGSTATATRQLFGRAHHSSSNWKVE